MLIILFLINVVIKENVKTIDPGHVSLAQLVWLFPRSQNGEDAQG